MSSESMINPLTGRPIKIGSRVHRQLVAGGLLEGVQREAGRPVGSYKVVDHTQGVKNKKNVTFKEEAKKELNKKLKELKRRMEKSRTINKPVLKSKNMKVESEEELSEDDLDQELSSSDELSGDSDIESDFTE